MSWSLPRLYLRPQRERSSSEWSVRRPLFWTAILRRMGSLEAPALCIELQPLGHDPIAPAARHQVARDAADGGDAHAGLPVTLPIRQAPLQPVDPGPAVSHRLQLRGGAQVAEEAAALVDGAQCQDRIAERAFVL